MTNKVAIITGGGGFIGSHLLSTLIESKLFYGIILLDIKQSTFDNEKISLYCYDISMELNIPVSKNSNCTIFHLAALCKERIIAGSIF